MQAEIVARQDAAYKGLEIMMLRHTVSNLFKKMQPLYKDFPNNYFVIDVETTGIEIGIDLITQLGYCLVRDSKAVDYAGIYLDWTSRPDLVNQEWLKNRLLYTKQAVEFRDGKPTGKTYHTTYERLAEEGGEPVAVLEQFRAMFDDARQHQLFFVAHNGYRFDAGMLGTHFHKYLNKPFVFGDNELFDTGMVHKGAQSQGTPWRNDTVKSWSLRVSHERLKNVKWALDTVCVPKYGLDKKYNLKMDQAHDAGFDCYATHLLVEEYKAILAGQVPEPSFS